MFDNRLRIQSWSSVFSADTRRYKPRLNPALTYFGHFGPRTGSVQTPVCCGYGAIDDVVFSQQDSPVRLFLGPSWGRVFKILLSSVGRRIEQAVQVGERFSTTSVRRIGVKKIITQTKEYA
jgi:hypothetical protein